MLITTHKSVSVFLAIAILQMGCQSPPSPVGNQKGMAEEMRGRGDIGLEEIKMLTAQIRDEATQIATLETKPPQPPGHIIPPEMRDKDPQTYGEEVRNIAIIQATVQLRSKLEELQQRNKKLEELRYK